MTKKTVTKEIHLLEREDIINALSEREGRNVRLDEISVWLQVCIPTENGFRYEDFQYCDLDCYFSVEGGGEYSSRGWLCFDAKENRSWRIYGIFEEFFCSCPFYAKDEEIFAFDTAEFKEYGRSYYTED